METMSGTTVEDFKAKFDEISDRVVRDLTEKGSQEHKIVAFFEDGEIHEMSFDKLAREAERRIGPNVGAVKDATYTVLGLAMKEFKCLGYMDIMEAYCLRETADLQADSDKDRAKKFSDLIGRHGKSLGDVPGRIETLVITGRFKDYATMRMYRIEKIAGQVVLRDESKDMNFRASGTRTSGMWEAIDENTGMKVSSDGDHA